MNLLIERLKDWWHFRNLMPSDKAELLKFRAFLKRMDELKDKSHLSDPKMSVQAYQDIYGKHDGEDDGII